MNILELKDISKSYKNKNVLHNINLSINSGEIVGLVGANGAGKTTLMKIINSLCKADTGEVKICGISPMEDREKYFSYISSIIETPSLYEDLSGYDNINFIGKINKKEEEKLKEIIEFVGIGDKINDKVKNYSLGMKQRVALGMALIKEPKLLILDEPTNGLDANGTIELRNTLQNIVKAKDISILISSHILDELNKICTEIIFIKDGRLIKCDSSAIKNYGVEEVYKEIYREDNL